MTHLMIRIKSFQIIGPYSLRVTFDDDQEREINFEPVLHGYYYGPLRDIDLFNQVRLDAEVHTLVWPNGADFDPATLHDWPQLEDAMIERAKRWELITA